MMKKATSSWPQADSTFLPFFRRARRIFRPLPVLIRFRKPCTFFRCRRFGWYVGFTLTPPSTGTSVHSPPFYRRPQPLSTKRRRASFDKIRAQTYPQSTACGSPPVTNVDNRPDLPIIIFGPRPFHLLSWGYSHVDNPACSPRLCTVVDNCVDSPSTMWTIPDRYPQHPRCRFRPPLFHRKWEGILLPFFCG